MKYKPGWIIKIVGQGKDKSDIHIVKINEPSHFAGEKVSFYKKGAVHLDDNGEIHYNNMKLRFFSRKGAKIFIYRSQARIEKKRIGWKTNVNSWRNQIRHENIEYYIYNQ